MATTEDGIAFAAWREEAQVIIQLFELRTALFTDAWLTARSHAGEDLREAFSESGQGPRPVAMHHLDRALGSAGWWMAGISILTLVVVELYRWSSGFALCTGALVVTVLLFVASALVRRARPQWTVEERAVRTAQRRWDDAHRKAEAAVARWVDTIDVDMADGSSDPSRRWTDSENPRDRVDEFVRSAARRRPRASELPHIERPVARVASSVNVPELRALLRQFAEEDAPGT